MEKHLSQKIYQTTARAGRACGVGARTHSRCLSDDRGSTPDVCSPGHRAHPSSIRLGWGPPQEGQATSTSHFLPLWAAEATFHSRAAKRTGDLSSHPAPTHSTETHSGEHTKAMSPNRLPSRCTGRRFHTRRDSTPT